MSNYLKQGDTNTPLRGVLKDKNGVVDLRLAEKVSLYVKKKDGSVLINGEEMIVLDAINGEVSYYFSEEDVSNPGVYGYEIVVTWDTGSEDTFPNDGLNTLVISSSVREVL